MTYFIPPVHAKKRNHTSYFVLYDHVVYVHILIMQLLETCQTTDVLMNEVMDHFKESMVPSIMSLQKSAFQENPKPTLTVVSCIKQLISFTNNLSEKTEVSYVFQFCYVQLCGYKLVSSEHLV